MPNTWKKNVKVTELAKAKVVGITLTTPGIQTGPIHKITLNEKGEVTHQENTPEWGRAFETFPPAFKDLSEISKWSFELLEDCYGCGDIIEQKVSVLETFKKQSMLEKIEENLRARMSHYTDSRHPSNDEVRIAWLITEVAELTERLKRKPIKSEISINSYPPNYKEEVMPQVIVEIKYREDYSSDDAFRKEEALALATKLEVILKEIL